MNDLRTTLVAAIKDLRAKYNEELESKKENGSRLLERPDFLWYELLQSYATWGGSRGYESMIQNSDRYGQITYIELKKLGSTEKREDKLRQIMREADVRYSTKKAPLLARCFEKIEQMGGLEVANADLLSKKSATEMMDFLDDFPGIGPKYARDIMMDAYHPFFRDKIALDTRVRSISKALGIDPKDYDDHEKYYLLIAKDAGVNGWELDRLLYNHTDDFLEKIR